jgi:hypothetical protein
MSADGWVAGWAKAGQSKSAQAAKYGKNWIVMKMLLMRSVVALYAGRNARGTVDPRGAHRGRRRAHRYGQRSGLAGMDQ